MDAPRMVVLTAVPTAFQAQVLAARLGADGILWQLRSLVGAPYNLGGVEVLVPADQLAEARDLLLVDEVEAALESADPEAEPAEPRIHQVRPPSATFVDATRAQRQRHRVLVRAMRLWIVVVVAVICFAVVAAKLLVP